MKKDNFKRANSIKINLDHIKDFKSVLSSNLCLAIGEYNMYKGWYITISSEESPALSAFIKPLMTKLSEKYIKEIISRLNTMENKLNEEFKSL